MKQDRGLVAVAMSGGVDSSVAAALLLEKGYRVIGLTMRLRTDAEGRRASCCSLSSEHDATAVAVRLGFPHYTLDVSQEFLAEVIQDFIREYLLGRTPNPCERCNAFMKWQVLWDKAQTYGADYFATGHYARVQKDSSRMQMRRAAFRPKDQSYALWRISQEHLKHTLFPLGELSKTDVRKKASELELVNADAADSQEICFIPEGDYRDFLLKQNPEALHKIGSGEIVGPGGKVLGTHNGFPNYTIGQRKGLGLTWPRPLYVRQIDAETNRIFVDEEEGCYGSVMHIEQVNWVSWTTPTEPFDADVQIRYRDPSAPAHVVPQKDGTLIIEFVSPAFAIAPGQSAVFYQGDMLLGGGIISSNML